MTDERKALFWLSDGGTSSDKLNKLLEIYGSALEVYNGFSSGKLREFLGERVYSALRATRDEGEIDRRLRTLKAQGIRVLLRSSADYPELLRQSDTPPAVLYIKGNDKLLCTRCLSVVGTRRCTDYGKRVATDWTAELATEFTIVTGHATGIDTYAAKSALAAGGKVICLLACGMDLFDPPPFMKEKAENLLLVTEYPNGTHTEKFMYAERNRLFGGLSEAVVIVEAARKSGALITADLACKQNRTVFAVPGSVFSERSAGVNELIRNGATAVTSVDDIFDDLGLEKRGEKEKTDLSSLSEEERRVYEFLSDGARRFDEIADMLGVPPAQAASLLSMMELSGIIEKKMQNYYALAQG